MEKNIQIYIADDHQVLIEGIKAVLKTNKNFEVVGWALNGVDLITKVEECKADILIMDINMPEKDGLEVLKEFALKKRSFKIIILSSYDDLKLVREVMNLGAQAYLTKQCVGENIIEAIQEIENGEEYFCKSIREKIFNSFIQNNQKKNPQDSKLNIHLTERELVIIKLISLELSGKEISEKLFISTNTVETHRKNLLKKLHVNSSVGLVKYAIKHQLIKI